MVQDVLWFTDWQTKLEQNSKGIAKTDNAALTWNLFLFFNGVPDVTIEGSKKLYLHILEIKDSLTASFDEF